MSRFLHHFVQFLFNMRAHEKLLYYFFVWLWIIKNTFSKVNFYFASISQLDDAAIQVYKDGDFGAYLDLESSLVEQSEEIEGLNSRWVIIIFNNSVVALWIRGIELQFITKSLILLKLLLFLFPSFSISKFYPNEIIIKNIWRNYLHQLIILFVVPERYTSYGGIVFLWMFVKILQKCFPTHF